MNILCDVNSVFPWRNVSLACSVELSNSALLLALFVILFVFLYLFVLKVTTFDLFREVDIESYLLC